MNSKNKSINSNDSSVTIHPRDCKCYLCRTVNVPPVDEFFKKQAKLRQARQDMISRMQIKNSDS
jgi:hypothetical protein